MHYPYIENNGVTGDAYNSAKNTCANYPGCSNKRELNYPGYSVVISGFTISNRIEIVPVHSDTNH